MQSRHVQLDDPRSICLVIRQPEFLLVEFDQGDKGIDRENQRIKARVFSWYNAAIDIIRVQINAGLTGLHYLGSVRMMEYEPADDGHDNEQ